jgi:hypothetical protein
MMQFFNDDIRELRRRGIHFFGTFTTSHQHHTHTHIASTPHSYHTTPTPTPHCTNHSGKHAIVELVLSGDMVFLVNLLGLKRANSKCPCLFCLVYGDNRGVPELNSSYPPRPINDEDKEALELATIATQEEGMAPSFDFWPELGYKGECAIPILQKEIAVERLHLRINIFKKIMTRVVQLVHKHGSVSQLNDYVFAKTGIRPEFTMEGKATCPHLKEHEIEAIFQHKAEFEQFLPAPLGMHFNTMFDLLGQIFAFASVPSPTLSIDHVGETLLSHLITSIPNFGAIFQPKEITPYLHVLCSHIQRTTDVHGGLGSTSTSIVETVNFKHTRKLISHTAKGGGNPSHHFWFDVVLQEKMSLLMKKEELFSSQMIKLPFM